MDRTQYLFKYIMPIKAVQKNTLIIALCLAGLGQRFLDNGYKTPKFLLLAKDKETTILELILRNFITLGNVEFVLMLNDRHKKWGKDVLNIIEKLEITFQIEFIKDTQGQAETAFFATEVIKNNYDLGELKITPLAFHNGDTILLNRDLESINKAMKNLFDGVIDTFNSDSNNFSYISTDSNSRVKKIIEKEVISNKATTGFYIFPNIMKYRFLYKKINKNKKELFISDVYSESIKLNQRILNLHFNDPEDTIILGTPIEYENWLQND